jgi:hypothetical protein
MGRRGRKRQLDVESRYWQVRARQGDSDSGEEWLWEYDDEQTARAMVGRLLAADGLGDWRDITDVTPC